MNKAHVIQNICEMLHVGKRNEADHFASQQYPFVINVISKRQYSRFQMCKVFLSDGFIDRYSGDQLIFPGLIRLLTLEFPVIFRYHKNWKMTETHLIYWELFPTIDHIIPVARNGADLQHNMVTTSMIRNSAKSNWLLEELGWELYPKGNLNNWNGLIHSFLDLCKKNPAYENDNYTRSWKTALVKAMTTLQIDKAI